MAGEWDAGFQRGAMGLGMGTALGALLHQVCFIAGTQVITGIEYEDELGQPATLTAKGFAHLAGESSTALQLRILRYLTQSIETLQPGQAVLTRDEHNPDSTLLLRHIEETFVRTAFHLQTITLRSSTGIEQTLHTTAEHPVYVLGKGWINAAKLAPGDQLQEPDGSTSTILASHWTRHRQGIPVYNFRVHDSHTYFVREQASTAEPVWVHNECGASGRQLSLFDEEAVAVRSGKTVATDALGRQTVSGWKDVPGFQPSTRFTGNGRSG